MLIFLFLPTLLWPALTVLDLFIFSFRSSCSHSFPFNFYLFEMIIIALAIGSLVWSQGLNTFYVYHSSAFPLLLSPNISPTSSNWLFYSACLQDLEDWELMIKRQLCRCSIRHLRQSAFFDGICLVKQPFLHKRPWYSLKRADSF